MKKVTAMLINVQQINARLETLDFDLDRNFNVEVCNEEKAMLIDILNWMTQHDMHEMVFKRASDVLGVHNALFHNSALVRERQMIIMQGVPGAGKTEVAKLLASSIGARIVSNNDHMVDTEGNYVFDPSRLQEVADKCFDDAENFVKEGWSVIVDNTNIDYREAGSYIELAMNNGYRVQIIRCERSSVECVTENIHNVPDHTIFRRHSMMKSLVN